MGYIDMHSMSFSVLNKQTCPCSILTPKLCISEAMYFLWLYFYIYIHLLIKLSNGSLVVLLVQTKFQFLGINK